MGSGDAFLRALEERGLTRRLGFGERPAVIVVDLINAFTDASRPFGSALDAEVEATRRLLEEARGQRLPVYFTTVAYDDPDLADAGIWAVKVPASETLRTGSPEVDLDMRLGRGEGEPLLVKKYASAFFGTDLATRLTARGIDTLVIAGCTTSGCVRATAVDALQHGFRPMVVLEAVGDRSPEAHRQSLLDLQAKYADVVSLDEASAALRATLAASLS